MYMKNPVNDVNTSYFSEAELRVVKLLASGSSEKEIILLYIAQLNHKPFSLANIKQ